MRVEDSSKYLYPVTILQSKASYKAVILILNAVKKLKFESFLYYELVGSCGIYSHAMFSYLFSLVSLLFHLQHVVETSEMYCAPGHIVFYLLKTV